MMICETVHKVSDVPKRWRVVCNYRIDDDSTVAGYLMLQHS